MKRFVLALGVLFLALSLGATEQRYNMPSGGGTAGGALTPPVSISGVANTTQLLVKAYSTQTSALFALQRSTGKPTFESWAASTVQGSSWEAVEHTGATYTMSLTNDFTAGELSALGLGANGLVLSKDYQVSWGDTSNDIFGNISDTGLKRYDAGRVGFTNGGNGSGGFVASKGSAINGSADEVQLDIKGHSTQTSSLQTWTANNGTVVGSMDVGNGGTFEAGVLKAGTASNGDSKFLFWAGVPCNLYIANSAGLVWDGDDNTTSISGNHVGLRSPNTGVLALDDGGNGAAGGVLEFMQVSTGGTVNANSGRIYVKDVAGTAEVHVKDEAGNETKISPHDFSKIEAYAGMVLPWVMSQNNQYLGKSQTTDMGKAIVLLETLARERGLLAEDESLSVVEDLPEAEKKDWDATQEVIYEKAKKDYEFAKAQLGLWLATPKDQREGPQPTVPAEPKKSMMKQIPSWIKQRLAADWADENKRAKMIVAADWLSHNALKYLLLLISSLHGLHLLHFWKRKPKQEPQAPAPTQGEQPKVAA